MILVGLDGLRVDGTNHTVRKNQLQNAGLHGIGIEPTASSLIVDSNKSVKAGADGVRIEGDSSALTKNKSTQSGSDGFHIVAGATGNSIEKNTASKSGSLDANEENAAGVNAYTGNHFKNLNLP